MFIKPDGFDLLHNRGGGMHRLRADQEKWKPLGIGEEKKALSEGTVHDLE
jgi:lysine 2,3-aminomutase